MCECTLLVSKKTGKPIKIEQKKHRFIYTGFGKENVLLEGIDMKGVIDYAAAYEIKNEHGVKSGYMFIVGECADI